MLSAPTARKTGHRAASAFVAIALLSSSFAGIFSLKILTTHAVYSQCSDGVDNDHDGKTDYPQDDDCESLDDDYEGLSLSGNFVTITDGHETVQPGGAVVYVITLKQQRQDARVVNVTLLLPSQSNIVSASDGGSVNKDTVRWTNVSVYKNVTRTITVNANVSPDAVTGQYLVARATVEGEQATDTTLIENYVPPQGDRYTVSLTDNRDFVLPGNNLTYNVRVRNTSSQTQTTDVRLALPYEVNFVSATDGGVRDSFNVTWKNITLAPNEVREFSTIATVDSRTRDRQLIRAKAYVGTVVATDQTVVRIGLPYNAISASITDNHSSARTGDLLTYTVTVRNDSDVVGTNVSIDASLPQYAEFVSATEGGYWDGSNIRWLIMQVAPHGTRTLKYTIRVRSDAPLGAMLTASVSADGNTSRDTTDVGQTSADPSANGVLFTKTADRAEAVPGSSIRYTLFIRNTLDHAIADAMIVDRYDSRYLSLTRFEQGQQLVGNTKGEMRWQVPVLQPGESWETTYVLAVSKNAPTGLELDNVATLRGSDLGNISLTEKVRTTRAGVLTGMPSTGAETDVMLGLALTLMAGVTAFMQRKMTLGGMTIFG